MEKWGGFGRPVGDALPELGEFDPQRRAA